MNRLLIDKQQWDAEHELRKEDMGLKRLQVMSQMQDAELRRKSLEKEAALAQDQMTPVDVNIYDYIPNNNYTQTKLFDKTDAGKRFASLMGGADVNRATGQVIDANGDPIRGPKSIVATKAGRAYGVVSAAMDPEEMVNENIQAASSKIQEMEAQLNSIPSADVAKRAELKTRIAEAKNVLKEHYNMLEPEQLEPLYRQRMKLIDNLSLNVAASGGDKDILVALQQSAQRANADYLSIQQRRMQKEERAKDRDLRRWETEEKARDRAAAAEATKEAARIRAKGGTEKTQREWAIKQDKDGNIVDVRPVDVIKEGKAAPTVEEATGGELKGYTWSKQSEMINQNMKGQNIEISTAYRALENLFKSENSMGQLGMAPADQPRVAAAMRYFKATGANNEIRDAEKAARYVISAEKMFWEDVDSEVQKAATALKRPIKSFTQDEINFIATKLANEKGGFVEDFGYPPRIEHRLSLDRHRIPSPLRPKIVE